MVKTKKQIQFISLITLIISSILGLISLFMVVNEPAIPGSQAWLQTVSLPGYSIAKMIKVYAYMIAVPGFWAVFDHFGNTKRKYILGFLGMFLAVLGSAIPLIPIGVQGFVYPVLAMSPDPQTLLAALNESGMTIFLLFSGVYYLTGIILLASILFRKQANCLAAGILLIIHGITIILPNIFILEFVSWLTLLASAVMVIVVFREETRSIS